MLKKLLLSLLFVGTLINATPPSEATVTRLYIATFDRAPDSAGLSYWLNDSGLDLEGIATSFFDQEETEAKYPSGFSHADFIEEIYKNLFARGTDSDGFEYWHGELEGAKVGRSVFILAVINGALGDDAKILSNKTKVGLAFVKAGRDDIDEAKEIMLSITADATTVNPTLCKHTLSGCYTAPIVEEEEEVIEEEEEEEETTTSTSGGSSGGGSGGGGAITPSNNAPIANAGADQTDVAAGEEVSLDGSGSSDVEGDTLTYLWAFTAKPPESSATLDSTTSDKPSFTADKVGTYTLSLTVSDGIVSSDADSVSITTIEAPPKSTVKKTGQTKSYEQNDDGDYKAGVAHDYTINASDSTVTDKVTKLIWQDDTDVSTVSKNWTDAGTYCSNKGSDWRLPTVKELLYIVDSSTTTNPNGFTVTTTGYFWSSTTYAGNVDGGAWYANFGGGSVYSGTKYYELSVRCVRGGQ